MIGGPSFHLSAWYATLKKAALKRSVPSEKQVADVNIVNSTFIRFTGGMETRREQYATLASDSKMSMDYHQTVKKKQKLLSFHVFVHIVSEKIKVFLKHLNMAAAGLSYQAWLQWGGHFSQVLQFANTTRGGIINLQGSGKMEVTQEGAFSET